MNVVEPSLSLQQLSHSSFSEHLLKKKKISKVGCDGCQNVQHLFLEGTCCGVGRVGTRDGHSVATKSIQEPSNYKSVA